MELFKYKDGNKEYSIVCDWKKTRTGFYHKCTLFYGGNELSNARASYMNRTWEEYPYQVCIRRLLNAFFKEEKQEWQISQ